MTKNTVYKCGDKVWALNDQRASEFYVLGVTQTMKHPESSAYKQGSNGTCVVYRLGHHRLVNVSLIERNKNNVFASKKDLLESL